jgi:outer membrane biosynthesis protein TonB
VDDLRLGFIFSAVFHITLVTVAVIGIPALKRPPAPLSEAIPVELVTVDDVNRIRAEAQKPKPEPKPQRTATAQPQAIKRASEPAADAVPMPEAKPAKKPEVKPKPKPQVMPTAAPRSKPKPPRSLDTGRLSALIDRSIKETETAPEIPKQDNRERLEEAVKSSQLADLRAQRSTVILKSIVERQVERCWSPPAGAKDAQDLVVKIGIWLTPEGQLMRPPKILSKRFFSSAKGSYYRVAAESAARAVHRCAPYTLPKDKYEEWKYIEFNFDPGEMLGG